MTIKNIVFTSIAALVLNIGVVNSEKSIESTELSVQDSMTSSFMSFNANESSTFNLDAELEKVGIKRSNSFNSDKSDAEEDQKRQQKEESSKSYWYSNLYTDACKFISNLGSKLSKINFPKIKLSNLWFA
jgi:hypothetical protein